MKTLLIAAAVLAIAGPALADTMTVKFDGTPAAGTYTFNLKDHTMTPPGGAAIPYTWDAATRKLCAAGQCATFDKVLEKVGETTSFTDDKGLKGGATLISITSG